MKHLLTQFVLKLREKNISYTELDKLRIQVDTKADNIQDRLLRNGIKNCTWKYHHYDMENTCERYHLIGEIYYYIDRL